MRLLSITGLLCILAVLYSPGKVIGQIAAADSLFYNKSLKNALSVYHKFLPNPSGLYNGSQYVVYAYLIKDDHPYFKSDSMKVSNISYDSVVYENVPLLYDIVKEMLVINDPFKMYKISLINEKINGFKLLDHEFIRIVPDSSNRHVMSTGFYDRLYNGRVILYERERKEMQEVIVNQQVQHLIIPQDNFYLQVGGKFYSVNRKRTLLRLLNSRRKEIQQFIRKNKLNYRLDKENTLVKVITYYDALPLITDKNDPGSLHKFTN